jgi:hypothetical protein
MNKYEYEMLANSLLVFVRENFDEVEIVEKLLEWGFTYKDIKELDFDLETIKQAQKEINKGLIK